MREVELFRQQYDIVTQQFPELLERRTIHETIRRMVDHQVTDLITHSKQLISQLNPSNRDAITQHDKPVIAYSEAILAKKRQLKTFLRHQLYQHHQVHRMSVKGKNTLKIMFDLFYDDPRLLPPEVNSKINSLQAELGGDTGRARAIADYIAGMTDRYAIIEYQRIAVPGALG